LKLLFDACLSPKLVGRFEELFPGCLHVLGAGLAHHTPDSTTWEFAKANGWTIVTTDSDFVALSGERGAPPKVIRLQNCRLRSADIEALLRRNAVLIAGFCRSDRALLVIATR
jgi:predicted nuclease of predicted toxin-antitoxin system